MPVRIDREADAIYVYSSEAEVLHSAEVSRGIIADYDARGRVIGLEILDASKRYNTPLSGVAQQISDAKAHRGNVTKQQHYVWAFYLKAWANNKGFISTCWFEENKSAITSPENVAKELFFYRSHRLSDEDLAYLEWLVENASLPFLKDFNRSTISFFSEIYEVSTLLEELGVAADARDILAEHVQFAEKMFGEKYHSSIEQMAEPILRRARVGDELLLNSVGTYETFVFFVCQQLFRTRKIRNAIAKSFKQRPSGSHDPLHTSSIEQQIYANNLAFGILSEQTRYKFKILRNKTNVPFITGDQPVININDVHNKDVKIYYPISPKLSLLLDSESDEGKEVNALEVELLNFLILRSSEKQVFGSDIEYLTELVNCGIRT